MTLKLTILLLFLPLFGFGMLPQANASLSKLPFDIITQTNQQLSLYDRINFSRTCISLYGFMHKKNNTGHKEYLFATVIPLSTKLYTRAMCFYAKNKKRKSAELLINYEGHENNLSRFCVMENFGYNVDDFDTTNQSIADIFNVYGTVQNRESAHRLMNNIPVTRLLLEQNAWIEHASILHSNQYTPIRESSLIHFAIDHSSDVNSEYIAMLLEYISPNQQDRLGNTPLHRTKGCGNLFLASPFIDLNIQNNQGQTVIHCAALLYNNCKILESLLNKSGIDLTLVDKDNLTALDYAKGRYNGEPNFRGIELLEKYSNNID